MAASSSLREQLTRLHEVILRERECAKALSMEGLLAASKEKEALLAALTPAAELDSADRQLAATVRNENRRNAYLFWSTLNWVRESMAFFGAKTAPTSYSAAGSMISSQAGGRLLSGKV